MTRAVLLVCTAALAACNGETAAPSELVTATIIRRGDTVRFEVPVVVFRCDSSAGLLLQGIQSGNGMLLWLRSDSLARELPILGARDTVSRHGAIVAVRYYHQSVVHAFALDSGTVDLADSGASRRVTVSGSGMEVAFGARSSVAATIAALPAPADTTTTCVSAL